MNNRLFTEIGKRIRLHQSKVLYLFVGALTTFVNLTVYFLMTGIFGFHYIYANVAAWVAAVLFAYIANRRWVFRSENANIPLELWLFILSRLFSLLFETGLLWVSVALFRMHDFIAKPVLAVFVVVCNYITGKRIVFRRRT